MPVSDQFEMCAVDSLWVDREKRQRREILNAEGGFINPDGLLESVRERGVLSALLCHRSGEIIFGERRWTAAKMVGIVQVPVRYVEDMPELEARAIELEENLRRKELPWRDYVAAVAGLHETYVAQAAERGDKQWSMKATAQSLQLAESTVSIVLRVAEDFQSPRIARATSVREAYNALARIDERRSAEVMEGIISATGESFAQLIAESTPAEQVPDGATVGPGENNAPTGGATGRVGGGSPGTVAYPSGSAPTTRVAPGGQEAPDSILQADFTQWAASYAGPRFNLIHCDFPYGVNLFHGQWGGKGNVEQYEDTADVYEKLIAALCVNRDRLMAHSAHLVFWLSADVEIMWRTRELFRELAPELWFWPMPLVWHKTDNMGIASDVQRRGRHVYEVALVASREDRKVVKVVSDCYGAPTDKRYHPSTKPEPVLKHFLSALVDEHTRMLDPTCGSASSLRACEALGAESVLGLELDPEHCKVARSAMRQFRALRAAEKLGSGT